MKRLKSMLVTLAMLLCCVSASAEDFSVDGIYYNITDSEKLTVEVTFRRSSYSEYFNEYSGNVVIPQTVTYNNQTYSVTRIGGSAFRECSSLTSITIPNSVTRIYSYTFKDCSSLTSVTIPNSVISISNYAFEGCSSLTSVHISDIAAWCNIEFGSYSSSNPLYYAKHLFIDGKEITELVIPDGVTSIGNHAFRNCTSLTSVTIPNSVTSIGGNAFRECSSLTSVTIPNSVTSIGNYAFSGCSSLTSVHISDIAAWCNIEFGSSSNPLYYAKHLFIDGKEITELVIPDGVTSIGGYAFTNCSSLTSVTIPEGVKSIGDNAFTNCSSLTSVTIPDGVTSIGGSAFCICI